MKCWVNVTVLDKYALHSSLLSFASKQPLPMSCLLKLQRVAHIEPGERAVPVPLEVQAVY